MNKFTIIWQIVFLYAVIAVLVYFISNFSIFVPPPSSYDDHSSIKKIKTKKGKYISALYLENPTSNKIIIYSHGNAEDLGMIQNHVEQLYDLGFSVIAYDYSGYGTSEVKPSERATYDNIEAVYEYVTQDLDINPEHIVLYGRSLGGGPSMHLASKVKVGAVILESPFVSAFRVVTYLPVFPVDKYNNLSKIKKVVVPILFIHGTSDKVIPFWHSQKLYKTYKGPKKSFWVEGAGHNNIPIVACDKYFKVIKEFINENVK